MQVNQMSREMCYRCFWPKRLCWCSSINAIETQTKIVLLMHPKEYKHIKSATGRFTHLCLKNSEIRMGVCFDKDPAVAALIEDPGNFPVLLYPCKGAVNISQEGAARTLMGDRQLVVFLLDATWILAKKMFNRSPIIQKLPRIMFVPEEKSRYVIKKQPHDWCLSTIEATHELLRALEKAGIDHYDRPTQMLSLFDKMQQYQIACKKDPALRNSRQRLRPKVS